VWNRVVGHARQPVVVVVGVGRNRQVGLANCGMCPEVAARTGKLCYVYVMLISFLRLFLPFI